MSKAINSNSQQDVVDLETLKMNGKADSRDLLTSTLHTVIEIGKTIESVR